MAKTDIMGLLTGVSSQGLDPMTTLTPAQQRMEFGARRAKGLTGAVRGMLGGAPSIQEQLATGVLKKQLAEQQAMTDLDLRNPEDLIKLAKVQQASGDATGAAQSVAKAQKLQNIANRKESLLKVAREQGNELIEEYILSAGDTDSALNKIQEVLFRRDPAFKSSAPPTKSDIKLYTKLLQQYTDKELEDLNIPTKFGFLGIGGGIDDADKLIIINSAKEIATNFPKLGKKSALDEALRQYGINKSAESMPTGTPTDTNVVESSSQMTGAKIK